MIVSAGRNLKEDILSWKCEEGESGFLLWQQQILNIIKDGT